ncbi:MAG: hypothetical protein J7497_07920 [Chitinophagaceae bacterium]|nr:hypothetical protein [Chitinophagaceae bacterium]
MMKKQIFLLLTAIASITCYAQNDKSCPSGKDCEKGSTPTEKANTAAGWLGGMSGNAVRDVKNAIEVRERTLIDPKPGPTPSPNLRSASTNGLIMFFTELDNEVRIFKSYNGGKAEEIYFAVNHNTQAVNPEAFKKVLLSPNEPSGKYTFIIELTNLPNPGRNNPWAINGKIYCDATIARPEESKLVQQIVKSSGGRSEEAFKEQFIYNFDK